MKITASHLYNHVSCPRRVDLDVHGEQSLRSEISPFVRLLWERGAGHEAEVVAALPRGTVLLAGLTGDERARETAAAMAAGAELIHGGRISADYLLGDPDLLVRRDGAYVAADIKSGRADEDGDEDAGSGRPKPHYAVQVALYTDVLERLGMSAGRRPEIWDVRGDRVTYELDLPRGARTPTSLWDLYTATRDAVRAILGSPHSTKGALSASCGFCHWREVCLAELIAVDDLTLLPSLGRAARDALAAIPTVAELAAIDVDGFIVGKKTTFPGIGPDRLRLFQARAVYSPRLAQRPISGTWSSCHRPVWRYSSTSKPIRCGTSYTCTGSSSGPTETRRPRSSRRSSQRHRRREVNGKPSPLLSPT